MKENLSSLRELGTPRGIRRVLMTVFGVLICGFGVSMCRLADFGLDPFQCMCFGIYGKVPLPQGTLYILINAVFLVFALIFDRKQIGLGTFINMFLLGYVCDFGEQLFRSMDPAPTMAGRILWLAGGIFILCFSSSLYMTASLGVSTYDFVAICLSNHGVLPFRYMRIVTDLICVLTGWLLGFVPGIATIILALMMGPVISFLNRHFSVPLLEGKLLKHPGNPDAR